MYAQTSAYSERKDAGLSGLFADEIRTAKRTAKRTTTRTAMRVITEFGYPARRGGGTQLLLTTRKGHLKLEIWFSDDLFVFAD